MERLLGPALRSRQSALYADVRTLAGVGDALKIMLGGDPPLRVLGSIRSVAIQAAIRASHIPPPTADATATREQSILKATQLATVGDCEA